jgi:Arc/MetJ-type ribon-helix-helix transcriptional regulator
MKKPISATIDTELISWLDRVITDNSIYRNKSHIIEIALENMKLSLEEQEKAVKKEAIKKR